MKTYIKWEREVIEQVGISQYLFNLNFDLNEVGLKCRWELTFEPKKFINNLYEHLLTVCEKRIEEEKMFYQKADWTQGWISPSMLASLCMNLVTQGIQDVTDAWKNLFTVIVTEEKETLKTYREKTKWTIDELREHVRNNEKKIKELQTQSQEQAKTIDKTAWNSNEKSATPRWDVQVADSTTEENETTLQSPVEKKRWVFEKPTKTSLKWLI